MSLDWENAGKLNADFFDAGCDRHGSVGWRAAHFMDQDSQIGVYHALTSKIPLVNSSILDVGCGQGDLFTFLRQQGHFYKPIGPDLVVQGTSRLRLAQHTDQAFSVCGVRRRK